jgi:hypothetical protein
MAVGGEDVSTKLFESEKMNLREIPMPVDYDCFAVFIRPDTAEMRRLVGQTPLAVSA